MIRASVLFKPRLPIERACLDFQLNRNLVLPVDDKRQSSAFGVFEDGTMNNKLTSQHP